MARIKLTTKLASLYRNTSIQKLSSQVSTLAEIPPPQYLRRRVVVTGIGIVSPLGSNVQTVWHNLLQQKSGVTAIDHSQLPLAIAARVVRGTSSGQLNVETVVDRGASRTAGPDFITFALAAGRDALIDALLVDPAHAHTPCGTPGGPLSSGHRLGPYNRFRAGVSVGSGIGGIEEIGSTALSLGRPDDGGVRRLSPFFVPRILCNMAAGGVALAFGMRGPNLAPATACASGAHAIGDAARAIAMGAADMMLAGGAEACIGPLALAGFSRAKALATPVDGDPAAASRPFDTRRGGFVLGEGSAVLVLEEWEAARARGARVYAEIRGVGMSGDAHHVTSPPDDGTGALTCMIAALRDGGVPLCSLSYINAHATGTPVGDRVEATAIGRLLGSRAIHDRLPEIVAAQDEWLAEQLSHIGPRPDLPVLVSSTKGSIGHLLGAAGAIEAAFAVLALASGNVPVTLNLTQPDPALPTDVAQFPGPGVPQSGFTRSIQAALSNSFGFGGTNASLLFTSPPLGAIAKTLSL